MNEWQAMLRMRYNLLAGGSDKAELEARSYQVAQAWDVRINTQRVLSEDLGLAWNALQNARDQKALAYDYVRYSQRVKEAYQKQFSLGDRTLLDLLDEEGNSFYLVQLRTERSLGSQEAPLLIIPGMIASVDIVTGRKSILSYLLKPIIRARSEAFRER